MIPPRRVAGRLVHPVAFGAMNLSLGPAEADAIATVHAAIEAGAQLVDTADVYGPEIYAPHHNERLVGKALRAHPDVLLSTKVGVVRQGAVWLHCGRPDHLRGACEGSLAALGVETIDLLQLHAVDAEVAIEESVGALARLQDEGKARLLGLSNVTLAEVERARAVAEIVSVQNEASVFVAPDRDLLAYCAREGIALLGYAPMGGWRAGRVAHEPVLQEVATQLGHSPHEVVLAWLLRTSECLVPVCGGSSEKNVRSSMSTPSIDLPPPLAARLTRTYRA